jgi:hypothetical protein
MASEETPVEASSADVSIRLKYITDAFVGIRGLYLIAVGAWLAMLQVCIVFQDESWWWALGFLGSSAGFLITMLWIPRHHTRRFGVFRPNPAQPLKPSKKEIVIGVLTVGGFIFSPGHCNRHSITGPN